MDKFDPTTNIEHLKLMIFQPYAAAKANYALSNGTKFAHYCSADSAIKIIKSKEMWLRNLRCMNDFREADYGFDLLIKAYESNEGETFKRAINSIQPDASQKLEHWFNGWISNLATNCYISCISEHERNEDHIGRLSMWRAYGNRNGVALVVDPKPLFMEQSANNVFSTPVAYLRQEELNHQLLQIAHSINEHADTLKQMEGDQFVNNLHWAFILGVLSTKHPGFAEEREWRLIYMPTYVASENVRAELETISGVPQLVQKMPLEWESVGTIPRLRLNDYFNKAIVGPSMDSASIYEALLISLRGAEIENPEEKIFVSDIPLRLDI